MANKNGYTAYVAGGFVRDLLLRISNTDIDIVIEGDGIDFAKKLAVRLNGHSKPHKKFKTAVVVMPDGYKIDVATARIEYYEHPAALPTVEMSAIRNDLYRRDFSINAMAIRLNGAKPYALFDFFGGQADLKDHAIRVLHNLSFVEDPTRVFRAVRFEGRYGFTIGKQTLNLVKSAVDAQLFNRLSESRTFAELKLIFKERRPVRALLRLKELGLLRFIHPALALDKQSKELMDNCEDLLAWHTLTFPAENIEAWLLRFMAAIDRLKDEQISQMAVTFLTSAKIINRIIEDRKLEKIASETIYKKGPNVTSSTLYEVFTPIGTERLLLTAAKDRDGVIKEAVTTFLTKLTDIKPMINGQDLINLGATPSPGMKNVLKQLLHAQIDLKITTREEAEKMAKELLLQGNLR
ncbi:tRNA nucleotidyltransferase, A-adding [hydrothermal vent metagenome]|uniref:tRNA nucleotidyltransferase, A-adding n=1 Tax=hydrothermal vent metagenome TaxID=652676 RepID=A0A3B1BY64_9ZZZZ